MKKDNVNKKVAVSRSPEMTCSADALGDDAERYDAEYNDFKEQEKPLGYDDPNCCERCGDDLGYTGFCWSCDF